MEGVREHGKVLSVKKSEPTMVEPKMKKPADRFYFLCNLDQNVAVIVKTLHCFKKKEDVEKKNVIDVIKRGLEDILVHYYPLGGKLTLDSDGKLVVDCSKLCVPFVEAVSDCEMDDLGDLNVPNPVMFGNLIHTVSGAKNMLEMPLLTIQVTKFKCGGFTVGMASNHCMMDGKSATEFINSWAETSRGKALYASPFLDRSVMASRKPPTIKFTHDEFREIDDISNITLLYQKEQMVYKSFKFDPERLDKLKKLIIEEGSVNNCTTFTVLTALVWRARSKALKMESDQETKLMLAVDIRSKLNPPLPKGYFGNGIILACCTCSAGELTGQSLSFAVELIQSSIKMVTDDFIRSAIDYFEETKARPILTATLVISTWTKLPFNATDFGWGEPVQTGCVTLPEREVALFLSSGREKGTTLFLGLPETAMKNFQELIQV